MKNIVILGSTGSIGVNALDIARRLGRDWRVLGLSAQNNTDRLVEQALEFKPSLICVSKPEDVAKVRDAIRPLNGSTKIVTGVEGLEELASHPEADLVLSSVVGSVGLRPLVAAIKKGKTVALANKEALIVAGAYITKLAKEHKATLLPVDSEHSAIFQCIGAEPKKHIKKIIVTASGGPFYKYTEPLDNVTAEHALAHPTWIMGKKITIDSATLMNKGLEVIEAHHLFGIPYDQIEIVIHPQSIVHSLVEFTDGTVMAHLSNPDMRLPIQYAMTYPDRQPCPIKPLNLVEAGKLEFYAPDFKKFPCLSMALSAGRQGGTMPTVLSGANEIAVGLFLSNRISFTDIARIDEEVMRRHTKPVADPALDQIIEADTWARSEAQKVQEVLA